MSATYGVSLNRAGVNTANSPLLELRTPSTTRAVLRQLKITMAVLPTTAPRFVLARATNTPVAGTNNVPLPFDSADSASLCSFISAAWSTAPTFSTTGPWLEVGGLPLTLGAGLIWTYPGQGLIVPISGSLVFADLNASGATLGSFDVSAIWEE